MIKSTTWLSWQVNLSVKSEWEADINKQAESFSQPPQCFLETRNSLQEQGQICHAARHTSNWIRSSNRTWCCASSSAKWTFSIHQKKKLTRPAQDPLFMPLFKFHVSYESCTDFVAIPCFILFQAGGIIVSKKEQKGLIKFLALSKQKVTFQL